MKKKRIIEIECGEDTCFSTKTVSCEHLRSFMPHSNDMLCSYFGATLSKDSDNKPIRCKLCKGSFE